MRTAISPRFAMRIRKFSSFALPHAHQNMLGLDEFAVSHTYLDNFSGDAGAHRIHQLHGFDNSDNGVLANLGADIHKGRSPGFGAR